MPAHYQAIRALPSLNLLDFAVKFQFFRPLSRHLAETHVGLPYAQLCENVLLLDRKLETAHLILHFHVVVAVPRFFFIFFSAFLVISFRLSCTLYF